MWSLQADMGNHGTDMCGVSNGSKLLISVSIWVGTEPSWNTPSGLSMHPNCQIKYGSVDIFQIDWNGLVVCGSVQRVRLKIHIMLLLLLFDNCNWSKWLNSHRGISFWSLCRLRHRFLCNQCFSLWVLYLEVLRWSVVLLWSHLSLRCLDYSVYKTKNCWLTIGAHFQVGVTNISCSAYVEKAAITWYGYYSDRATLKLWKMEDKNNWDFVDTHFEDGACSMALLLWIVQAANICYMDVRTQSPLRQPKMQSHKSWILRWRSFSECCNDHVAVIFTYKGSQYIHYAEPQPDHFAIKWLRRLKDVHTLLTFIYRIG